MRGYQDFCPFFCVRVQKIPLKGPFGVCEYLPVLVVDFLHASKICQRKIGGGGGKVDNSLRPLENKVTSIVGFLFHKAPTEYFHWNTPIFFVVFTLSEGTNLQISYCLLSEIVDLEKYTFKYKFPPILCILAKNSVAKHFLYHTCGCDKRCLHKINISKLHWHNAKTNVIGSSAVT